MEQQQLIASFQRLFLAGRRLFSFPWAELEEQLKESRDNLLLLYILQKTVLHPLCVRHPPSVNYRRLFLSELIKKHESTVVEPLDELYEALGDVLNMDESTQCYKSYFLPTGETITLSENVAIISEGTTGLVTWEAALYLGQWAMQEPDLFNNRTVLELGSGTGLAGLTVCKTSHPKRFIFSDYHQHVLKQLSNNIQLNGFHVGSENDPCTKENFFAVGGDLHHKLRSEIKVLELDWETVTEAQLSQLQVEVVIAADVVYDPEIIVSLIRVLKTLLNCRTREKAPDVYVASTIRNPETYILFQTNFKSNGMEQQILPSNNNQYDFVFRSKQRRI
ncbi:hypothetical protein NDU88_003062 [Pleurodeles waltl]|uniref:FAM86 N-terminal domain-containing protein n=1 Tax=Pleurodeles waltl TaxID=8319 RepID=A0AAV7M3G2_PLEWA|nr:hypothetical protein NDU88_003062 [Pleurodeles waltl]